MSIDEKGGSLRRLQRERGEDRELGALLDAWSAIGDMRGRVEGEDPSIGRLRPASNPLREPSHADEQLFMLSRGLIGRLVMLNTALEARLASIEIAIWPQLQRGREMNIAALAPEDARIDHESEEL